MDNPPEHTVIYRDVKHSRLEYKTGTLQLILPKGCSNPEQILQKYQKWIRRKQKAINQALQEAETKTVIHDRTGEQLKALVGTLVQTCQKELNTKVFYRRMKTKWASRSNNSNLTINTITKHLLEN
jgi:predicted metal-dependent hydrolase